jgi:hypothetical protein
LNRYSPSLSRRSFIAASAASAALTALPIRANLGLQMLGIIDPATPHSAQFANALSQTTRIADLAQPRAMVSAMTQAHGAGYLVLACTREATAFVVGELLRGNRERLSILVRHEVMSRGRVRHELIGLPSSTLLSAALSGPAWAAKLARLVAHNDAPDADIHRDDPGVDPLAAGHLVTWLVTS